MPDIDIIFCRRLLAQIIPDVKMAGKLVNKDAWVWNNGRDCWEFHGPDDFYWYGTACNAYEARYKGWSAWLENPKGKH
jgi:hypothetical protein